MITMNISCRGNSSGAGVATTLFTQDRTVTVQVQLIGTFAMGPIILLRILKLRKTYWTPPGSS